MTPLKGSNLTAADATFLSVWLSIPPLFRALAVAGSLVSMTWTARGLFGEAAGLDERMTTVEEKLEAAGASRERLEAGLMYVMCKQANPDTRACDYLVRAYPEYLQAIGGVR